MAREFFDRQSQLLAYVHRSDVPNSKLVIFVHGFRGSYLSTWGELANYLTNHADDDPLLATWDYFFVGYETHSIDTCLAIAGIVGSQWEQASMRRPLFNNNAYSSLALFAHSLGTLGIRQLLCACSEQPAGMSSALKSAVLFGSPLNGSPLAGMGGFAGILDAVQGRPAALLPKSYRIGRALAEGNPELQMLHAWSLTMRDHGKNNFGPTRVILGADDQVVGARKLVDWKDDSVLTTAMGHSDMVKITGTGANAQGPVIDELRGLP